MCFAVSGESPGGGHLGPLSLATDEDPSCYALPGSPEAWMGAWAWKSSERSSSAPAQNKTLTGHPTSGQSPASGETR